MVKEVAAAPVPDNEELWQLTSTLVLAQPDRRTDAGWSLYASTTLWQDLHSVRSYHRVPLGTRCFHLVVDTPVAAGAGVPLLPADCR